MNPLVITIMAVLEAAALVLIVRLWLRRRMRIIPRILWSIVLLIPVVGLFLYGFVQLDPDKNPDDMDGPSDTDMFYTGSGMQ